VAHPSTASTESGDGLQFTLWQRMQFALVSWVVSAIVTLIGWTLRITFSSEPDSVQTIDEIYPGIYPFWHGCVLPAIWVFRRRRLGVITSESRDGEYIARVIGRFGFVPIRGSSSRGGRRAMVEMRQLVSEGGAVAFTIDGPRGPRRIAKRGPVVLARITGAPIVPFYVALDRFWTLRTWDQFVIPKPFARAYVRAANKIFVAADATEERLDAAHREMQAALERVTADAEAHFSSVRN
jgi:lysophospholipid acyltransferase (LPLAT)-like uncharacterized protein